jgi:hypothetical protein
LILEVIPRGRPRIVELSPLLKYCWSPDGSNCHVAIVQVVNPSCPVDRFGTPHAIDAEGMTRVLNSLANKTATEMKFYSRLTRTLGLVRLSTLANKLDIYVRPHFRKSLVTPSQATFDVSNDGIISRGANAPQALSMENLLSFDGIRRTLSDVVVGSTDGVLFDLDRSTMSGVPVELLGLNKALRNSICVSLSPSLRPKRVSMTTRVRQSSFQEFKVLANFIRTGPVKELWTVAFARSTIILRYDLDSECNQDIMIRALDFVKATSTLRDYTDVHVQIFTPGRAKAASEERLDLPVLRKKVFIFVIDLLKHCPDLFFRPAPYIWVDQMGTPREASEDSEQSTPAIYDNQRRGDNESGLEELEACREWLVEAKQTGRHPA